MGSALTGSLFGCVTPGTAALAVSVWLSPMSRSQQESKIMKIDIYRLCYDIFQETS